jgi:hypothetical protein
MSAKSTFSFPCESLFKNVRREFGIDFGISLAPSLPPPRENTQNESVGVKQYDEGDTTLRLSPHLFVLSVRSDTAFLEDN